MEKQVIPDDVKAAMWQFFLKTSVPRLIEKKRKEYEDQQKEREGLDDADLLGNDQDEGEVNPCDA